MGYFIRLVKDGSIISNARLGHPPTGFEKNPMGDVPVQHGVDDET